MLCILLGYNSFKGINLRIPDRHQAVAAFCLNIFFEYHAVYYASKV
jgi:hypothetical protein